MPWGPTLANSKAVATVATKIIRTQKAEEANPAPPMVEEKRMMIEAGEPQRMLKPKSTEVKEKPQPVNQKHAPEAPTNSNLPRGI